MDESFSEETHIDFSGSWIAIDVLGCLGLRKPAMRASTRAPC